MYLPIPTREAVSLEITIGKHIAQKLKEMFVYLVIWNMIFGY
ncbi:hypothetical protein [Peribacillus phoenicis]